MGVSRMASSTDIILKYQQTPNMWQINNVRIGGIKKLKTMRDTLIQFPKSFIYSEGKKRLI